LKIEIFHEFLFFINFFNDYSAKLNFSYFSTQRRGGAENFSLKNLKTLRLRVSALKNKLALANTV